MRDRVNYIAEILQPLPGVVSLLDVGCRKAKLAELIPPTIDYYGCDLEKTCDKVAYVGDFSTIDFGRQFSAVVALDVLEHTDRPSANFDRLVAATESHLIVTLPNCADLKTRVRFATSGRMGGKYTFGTEDPLDRHRWVMNFPEIVAFYRNKAATHDLALDIKPLQFGFARNQTLTSHLGGLVSALLPATMVTETLVGVFSKRKSG
jgi:SAM-dependent methyltransferase